MFIILAKVLSFRPTRVKSYYVLKVIIHSKSTHIRKLEMLFDTSPKKSWEFAHSTSVFGCVNSESGHGLVFGFRWTGRRPSSSNFTSFIFSDYLTSSTLQWYPGTITFKTLSNTSMKIASNVYFVRSVKIHFRAESSSEESPLANRENEHVSFELHHSDLGHVRDLHFNHQDIWDIPHETCQNTERVE